ncbi:MAG: Zn-ribbon domain-containing OB-fold protein [Candidatus Lokiarchaeota archaeon]|nr:Zn-ribbon domain-containing OB-fold protein [Candidatus Lokiarchaeota archaeon]
MNNEEFTIKNYFDFFAENKLMGNKCNNCGIMHIPPKKICNKCYGTKLEWIEFSGKGTLQTYSLIGVGARYFVNQGYKIENPYCFGIVQLEEGPCISGHIVGPEGFEQNPKKFKIGMPLKAKFLHVETEGIEPKIDLGFEPI